MKTVTVARLLVTVASIPLCYPAAVAGVGLHVDTTATMFSSYFSDVPSMRCYCWSGNPSGVQTNLFHSL